MKTVPSGVAVRVGQGPADLAPEARIRPLSGGPGHQGGRPRGEDDGLLGPTVQASVSTPALPFGLWALVNKPWESYFLPPKRERDELTLGANLQMRKAR